MYMTRKLIKHSALAICICLAPAFVACSKDKKAEAAAMAQAAQQVPELQTITATAANTTLNLRFPATIQGKTDIAVRPQVTGVLQTVNVEEGQTVSKGQVLFTIDPVTFQAAVAQAQAAVDAARVSVDNARLTETQNKLLLDKNIISPYVYQQAANALSAAQAQLHQANAALTSARKNLSYCTITAPSSGVVGQIPQRQGSYVTPQTALTTVSDISEVYAYFAFTEKDLIDMTQHGQLSQQQVIRNLPKVKLQLADGQEYALAGTVTSVSGVINPATGASSARALFPNPSGLLRSGNSGVIIMPQTYTDRIVIPQRATYELQDMRYAFKVEQVGDTLKAVQVPITVERLNDGQNFVITSGIQPGDQIIIEGVGIGGKVKNGMAVKVKK